MVVAALGSVLTAAYFLRLLTTITHGRRVTAAQVADVRPLEWVAWAPLIVLIVFIGLWPKALLDLTDAPVRALMGG